VKRRPDQVEDHSFVTSSAGSAGEARVGFDASWIPARTPGKHAVGCIERFEPDEAWETPVGVSAFPAWNPWTELASGPLTRRKSSAFATLKNGRRKTSRPESREIGRSPVGGSILIDPGIRTGMKEAPSAFGPRSRAKVSVWGLGLPRAVGGVVSWACWGAAFHDAREEMRHMRVCGDEPRACAVRSRGPLDPP